MLVRRQHGAGHEVKGLRGGGGELREEQLGGEARQPGHVVEHPPGHQALHAGDRLRLERPQQVRRLAGARARHLAAAAVKRREEGVQVRGVGRFVQQLDGPWCGGVPHCCYHLYTYGHEKPQWHVCHGNAWTWA